VRVWVDDPGNHLRLGQPVTATLETGEPVTDPGFTVVAQGLRKVFVAADGKPFDAIDDLVPYPGGHLDRADRAGRRGQDDPDADDGGAAARRRDLAGWART
jgi:hypothetical protein